MPTVTVIGLLSAVVPGARVGISIVLLDILIDIIGSKVKDILDSVW